MQRRLAGRLDCAHQSTTQNHPSQTLCTKRGKGCAKHHAPVDVELDSVILDVWARSWLSPREKRVPGEESDIFHVLLEFRLL